MRLHKITSSKIVSGCIVATSTILVLTARAETTTVVSPPGFGLEDIDGNVLFFFREAYPTAPIVSESTVRWQELHPASAFESLGPGPLQITQMAWRPDVSVYEAISNEWEGFHLLLSTTDVGTLGDTFSENYGPSGATDVFSGTLVLQTDGATRGPGLPHDFDYVIEFERPFFYYPEEGDLLFDASLEVPTATPWIWVDAELTGEYVEAKPNGPLATRGGLGLFVTEFTIVPEPSNWILGLLCAGVVAHGTRRRITRQPIPLYLTAGLLTISSAASADSLVYDFEQEGTGTVLAQLELSMLPATHEEVVSLTFTPAGQLFFGYNFALYPGTFTNNCVPFVDDGLGGLTGEEYCFINDPYIQSPDPPQSSLSPSQPQMFLMTVFDVDTLELSWPIDDDSDPHNVSQFVVTAIGDWRVVPEPTGLFLACWSVLVVVSERARRRPNCES